MKRNANWSIFTFVVTASTVWCLQNSCFVLCTDGNVTVVFADNASGDQHVQQQDSPPEHQNVIAPELWPPQKIRFLYFEVQGAKGTCRMEGWLSVSSNKTKKSV